MDGKVMAQWLKTSYPDMKILFTSGYNDAAVENLGAPGEGVEFLGKPYTPTALTTKIRQMLDERKDPRCQVNTV